MDINKTIAQVIADEMDDKGLVVMCSKGVNSRFIDVALEIEKGNVETGINAPYVNSHMALYAFQRMLRSGHATIVLSDDIPAARLEYLEKLAGSIKYDERSSDLRDESSD